MHEAPAAVLLALALMFLFPAGATFGEAAVAEQSYRFVVVADSRSDCSGPSVVNTAALGSVFSEIVKLDPRFVFFGGDLACGFATKGEVEAGFDDWRDTIEGSGYRTEKVYPVFGGHERVSTSAPVDDVATTWSAFESYFDPVAQSDEPMGERQMSCRYYDGRNNPPGDRTDFAHTVYYCDFGPDRFFVLNNDCIPEGHSAGNGVGAGCVGHELGCGQFNWIRRHLVDNGKRHNFFFQHEPAFGTGAHQQSCPDTLGFVMDNQKPQRNDYVRLLGHHNATAIFSGHEHQYTRRYIEHGLLDSGLNTDRVKTSLAILIKAVPVGQAAGPATAYSFDGSRSKAPKLKLWWTKKGGRPDWLGRIRASADDAEELATRRVYVDSSDLELMRDNDLGEQRWVALRWTDVPIPRGTKIEKARIQFTAKRDSTSGPKVMIRGEATAFAFPFSQCTEDVAVRKKTRRGKIWRIRPWKKDRRYQTPNLAKIFQQLLDRHGSGDRFPLGFHEIKTGSSGAPWYPHYCQKFMGNVRARVITADDYAGDGEPHHYAVVEVNGERVDYDVYSWDGTLLDSTR